jgi:hypothetical protein
MSLGGDTTEIAVSDVFLKWLVKIIRDPAIITDSLTFIHNKSFSIYENIVGGWGNALWGDSGWGSIRSFLVTDELRWDMFSELYSGYVFMNIVDELVISDANGYGLEWLLETSYMPTDNDSIDFITIVSDNLILNIV